MKRCLIALAIVAGCQGPTQTPKMPWLYGLEHPIVNTIATEAVARQIEARTGVIALDDDCANGFYPGIAIMADVAPKPGQEMVLASLARGIVVIDAEDQLLTETSGYPCSGGSADELLGLAAGDTYGVPTIAIAATAGGHREGATWISLFRIGPDKKLDAVFTGTVELRSGDQIERGSIVLLPNALVYRHPRGTPELMIYNPVVRAYLRPLDDHEASSEIIAAVQP